jgi:hypothetical protein
MSYMRLRGPRFVASERIGRFRIVGGCALYFVAAALFLFAHSLFAQDTTRTRVLVEVRLITTGESLIAEGEVRADSALLLPSEPIAKLLGVTFVSPIVTPWELEAAYPDVKVVFETANMRVLIYDKLNVLPASRRATAAVIARAQDQGTLPVQSAPFVAVAVDDSARVMADVGYAWKGRIAVMGRIDRTRASSVAVSLAPTSHVFVSANKGPDGPVSTTARVSLGPLWVSSSYAPHAPVDVAGVVRVKDITVYSSMQYAVATYSGPHSTNVQVAHAWTQQQRTTAVRVSVGPSWASPISFPQTFIRRQ